MQLGEDKQFVHISASSVFKAAMVLLFIYLLFLLKDLVLVILTAIVIASALEPGSRWLIKRRIPRVLAVVSIYLFMAVIVGGVFYFVVPTLLDEISIFLSRVPQYIESVGSAGQLIPSFDSSGSQAVVEGVRNVFTVRDIVSNLSLYISQIPGGAFGVISSVFGGLLSFVLIIVISFYLSVQENGIKNFLHVIVPYKHQEYAVGLWERARDRIGKWMQGQILLVVLITVLVFLGLTILGVENAFLFAILAGLFELIPLFGPILASIPAILAGFGSGGFAFALIIAGLYIIIQQFENHLIYPLVVHKVIGIPPLLVILALIIGGQLAGFLGMILAVPVATALMELTRDIEEKNKRLAAGARSGK